MSFPPQLPFGGSNGMSPNGQRTLVPGRWILPKEDIIPSGAEFAAADGLRILEEEGHPDTAEAPLGNAAGESWTDVRHSDDYFLGAQYFGVARSPCIATFTRRAPCWIRALLHQSMDWIGIDVGWVERTRLYMLSPIVFDRARMTQSEAWSNWRYRQLI